MNQVSLRPWKLNNLIKIKFFCRAAGTWTRDRRFPTGTFNVSTQAF